MEIRVNQVIFPINLIDFSEDAFRLYNLNLWEG